MAKNVDRRLIDVVRAHALPLNGRTLDYDPILELVGESRFVLLGEASHGTEEFYRARAEITRRLIREKGFQAVAVEADWPAAYRVNRFVRGTGGVRDEVDALSRFHRFPAWMWRNSEVVRFVGWLRRHNDALPRRAPRVGFYGLDLYSPFTSMQSVLRYLERIDPRAARRIRERCSSLSAFGDDIRAYGYAASLGIVPPLGEEAVRRLRELRDAGEGSAPALGGEMAEELFNARENARLVKDAEQVMSSMYRDQILSWNLRDQHMAGTLRRLAEHLEEAGQAPKVVVWEHNSHLGDARATEMAATGELNVGQLMRQRYGPEPVLVGFSTYTGTVTAASSWDGPAERKLVRPALPGSYEEIFHRLGHSRFILVLRDARGRGPLREARLERTIGGVYLPARERDSHYFFARLADQFDAVLHIDETHAVVPLERTPQWLAGENMDGSTRGG